jgi:hypothetical protein
MRKTMPIHESFTNQELVFYRDGYARRYSSGNVLQATVAYGYGKDQTGWKSTRGMTVMPVVGGEAANDLLYAAWLAQRFARNTDRYIHFQPLFSDTVLEVDPVVRRADGNVSDADRAAITEAFGHIRIDKEEAPLLPHQLIIGQAALQMYHAMSNR